MGFLKKLTSLVIIPLVIFGEAPGIFANPPQEIKILVIGDKVSREKFINNTFIDKSVELIQALNKSEANKGSSGVVHNMQYENYVMRFNISKYVPSDENRSYLSREISSGKYPVILATVDVDNGLECAKQEISRITNYICHWKDNYVQVLITGCGSGNNQLYDDKGSSLRFFNKLANHTGDTEDDGLKYGYWKHLDNQFLDFHPSTPSKYVCEYFNHIIKCFGDYCLLKKKNYPLVESFKDFCKEHQIALIVAGVGTVLVVGAGLAITIYTQIK